MRLLGWMNHKFRQTSVEPLKDFTIGNYCNCLSAQSPIDDHVPHARTNFGSRYGSRKQSNENCENTFGETEAKGSDGNCEEEPSKVASEIFEGFLAIGTLGSELNISEPATPTLPMSVENISEDKAEVTPYDLKIITDELEKFFEAEAEEEGCNESLGRSSYVSTITLSGMQMEENNAEDNVKTVVCPLQGYLFGSSIELSETRTESRKEKASLGELFCKTKITDEISAENKEKGQIKEKKAHKSAKYLIKKMLTKLHGSSGNPIDSSGDSTANPFSTKKKLNKVLKMFHRKVHPEQCVGEKDCGKSPEEKMMKTLHHGGHNSELMPQEENKMKFLQGSNSMEGIQYYKNNLKQAQYHAHGGRLSRNKEYWIKTDAEYLVLEL